jgi:hypothetical protein
MVAVVRSSQRVDRRLLADFYARRVRQRGLVKPVRAIEVDGRGGDELFVDAGS